MLTHLTNSTNNNIAIVVVCRWYCVETTGYGHNTSVYDYEFDYYDDEPEPTEQEWYECTVRSGITVEHGVEHYSRQVCMYVCLCDRRFGARMKVVADFTAQNGKVCD